MKVFMAVVFGFLYLAAIAISVAVPVAIIWAAYHFITTYKG